MKPEFWTNTIWFILLGAVSFIQLLAALFTAKKRKLALALYFTVAGIAIWFDIVVFIAFRAYSFYPRFVPHLPFDDEVIGHWFSQFSVSATALLMAVLNVKAYWFMILAGLYSLIEEWFLHLGIYKHNWYRTWMTVVGLFIFFWIVSKMYRSSLKSIGRKLRYFYIFLGLSSLYLPTISSGIKLSGIRWYRKNMFPGYIDSYLLFSMLDFILISAVVMTIYFSKARRLWKITAVLALYVILFMAWQMKWVVLKAGWWFPIYATADIFGTYLYVFMLDKLYDRQVQQVKSD